MSSYRDFAYNPKTGRIEVASLLDDYFGRHKYGVKFDGDDKVYRPSEVDLRAAVPGIERLRAELAAERDALMKCIRALERYMPFLPESSAKDGGANRYFEHVCAADEIREALAQAKQALGEGETK